MKERNFSFLAYCNVLWILVLFGNWNRIRYRDWRSPGLKPWAAYLPSLRDFAVFLIPNSRYVLCRPKKVINHALREWFAAKTVKELVCEDVQQMLEQVFSSAQVMARHTE